MRRCGNVTHAKLFEVRFCTSGQVVVWTFCIGCCDRNSLILTIDYYLQVVFLVWNCVNDPLFAWLSDKKLLQKSNKDFISNNDIVLKRLKNLKTCGPLLSASFALIWLPLLPISLQFILCLCLYDGFLTVIDLQHSALLADLTVHVHERWFYNFSL